MNAKTLVIPEFSLRHLHVWRRNSLVWRKLAVPSMLGNLADPMLYMLGLGYGLGAMLSDVGGMSYIAFLAAGTVCSSTMMSATFEAMYSGFSRMHVQKTWDAIMNAPVTLDDVVLGEAVWAASKSLLSGAAVLLVAWTLGLTQSWLALWVIPIVFLTGLAFAGMGLIMTALSPSYDFFMYYFMLAITPMMLLSGVFFAGKVARLFHVRSALDAGAGTFGYLRAGLTLRTEGPLPGPLVGALEVAAGSSAGTVPPQSRWLLGGAHTLRGYAGAVASGDAFWRARAELANALPAARVALFTDLGRAGDREHLSIRRPLIAAGVGASFFDGLIRIDLARALRGPVGWRLDFYADGVLYEGTGREGQSTIRKVKLETGEVIQRRDDQQLVALVDIDGDDPV